MRIRAVRVREVGCFSAPIALEGLTGGLDLLCGPNEFGKSTLFNALNVLFTVAHTSHAAKVLTPLRPYAGGSPLIEADFEADGRLWRLRKQYLSGRDAILTDLGSGRVAARREDAERRVLELIGGPDKSGSEHRLGLVWLAQGDWWKEVKPGPEAREDLGRLIAREIQDASGGQELRVVREMCAAQRAVLMTAHKPPRPGGAYADTIRARDQAARDLADLKTKAEQADKRLERARILKLELAALSDPETIDQLRRKTEASAAARDKAAEALRQLKLADAEMRARESKEAEARAAFEAFSRQMSEARELEAADADGQIAEQEARASQAEIAAALAAARARRDDVRIALDAETRRLDARRTADQRREAHRQAEELAIRLSEAEYAARRADEIGDRLRHDPVTEERVSAALFAWRSIAALEGQIAAQSPTVRIDYSPGGAGRIRVGGQPVGDGHTLAASQTLTFEIEGVGTIQVIPALSENLEDARSDLEAHKGVLSELMATMAVTSIEECNDRLSQRQSLTRAFQQAQDQFRLRAPQGLEQLRDELARLVALGEGSDGRDLPERDVIEAEVRRLKALAQAAERELEQLTEQHVDAERRAARLSAEGRVRRERLAALARALPSPEMRSERLAELDSLAGIAAREMREAARDRAAWAEAAPDDTRMLQLQAEADAAARAETSAADERIRIERELAVLTRDLERDLQDGAESKVAEAEQRVGVLDAQVAAFEREVSAFDLLLETLDAIERETRDRYLGPVTRRLQFYLEPLLPGARAGIGPALDVETIERGGTAEQLTSLSFGTREQIAVVARLAFARLLADTGRATPVIFDDALVYSDDARIEALFSALRAASEVHQVIILTCRARTFERLGGHKLEVAPWTVA